MSSLVLGLSGVVSLVESLEGFQRQIRVASDDMVKEMSYHVEDSVKEELLSLPDEGVFTGRLFCSIGNKSPTAPPCPPPKPEAWDFFDDPYEEQERGKTQAIWRFRRGADGSEVEIGSEAENVTVYPHDVELRGGWTHPMWAGFFRRGVERAIDEKFDDAANETVFSMVDAVWMNRGYSLTRVWGD